ncbi:MAG: cytochrome c [Pseudomonadota bacterium]
MRYLALFIIGLALATTAFAHEGVENPAVMKRMHGMKNIGSDLKIMVRMAKGETPFDQEAARAAAASIANHAADAPALFEAPEKDPKSEALPVLWENFDDFTDKAKDLEDAAQKMSTTVTSLDELRPALQELGAKCTACHRVYREKR